jgi:hypothetical protein
MVVTGEGMRILKRRSGTDWSDWGKSGSGVRRLRVYRRKVSGRSDRERR